MSLKEFEILQQIGSGAFSTVYKVRRSKDNTIYALKKMKLTSFSRKQKQNSLNQIRVLASIRNPYIITYKDAFIDQLQNYLCLVTQFADGGDLDKKIRQYKKLNQNINKGMDQDFIRTILFSVCQGLRAMHALNIAHRDIKPANIFLFSDGRVKIGDLNVSKVLKGSLCQTQTGTPYYASPQIWKDSPYSMKSDIWSFGCIIYEMTTLHPPFEADSMEKLYRKVIKGIFPKIPNSYSKQLRNWIRKMIQVDESNRPSCLQLLGFIQTKNMENQQENCANDELIGTIKIPKKINKLNKHLPQSNYSPKRYKSSKNIIDSTETKNIIRGKSSKKLLPSIRQSNKAFQVKINQMKIFEGPNKLHKVKSEKLLPINLPSLIHNIKERSSHMYC